MASRWLRMLMLLGVWASAVRYAVVHHELHALQGGVPTAGIAACANLLEQQLPRSQGPHNSATRAINCLSSMQSNLVSTCA